MYYYFVWVRSNRYHGKEALTYASQQRLTTGNIVQVELQKELVMGVVTGPTSEPRFQTKLITTVFDVPPLPAHLLKLASWLTAYYPAPVGIITQQLLPASFSQKQLDNMDSKNLGVAEPNLKDLPPLTSDQAAALQAMTEGDMQLLQRDTYLLHGTTGSGKTRLYIELAARTLAAGKSAIVLTPEISLTTQLGDSFRQVFGEARVVVMHSQQAPSERQAAWLACLRAGQSAAVTGSLGSTKSGRHQESTAPVIVIGPRSVLFSPVAKPGLIILDEAHESAYKQEQTPQYQTGRVAAYLAQLTRSTLVLGSATPAISDYYLAEQKNKPIIKMTQLAQKHDYQNSKITVVDHKDHNLFSRSPFLSLELIKAVEQALSHGEQSLLYLNRRGTARLVLCENCGWQATCPHCGVPLTYHGDHHELRCHSCNYHAPVPSGCPECGHANVLFKTAGTKAIVDEVSRLFPGARAARFDTDNAKAERFEQHYAAIRRGDVDILIGTQLLAKGLDLPRLSTLGVLLADTSLYLPDFSAEERTFQLISQVLGRIGRGHVAGRAIIQTYHPEHPVLRDALEGNYQHFYETELASRREFLFPPFCYLLKLTARRATSKAAEAAADKLKADIEASGAKVRVEGPAPSFYERFQNKYQWQLIIKARDRPELLKILTSLPANWSSDIDPVDLL